MIEPLISKELFMEKEKYLVEIEANLGVRWI